MSAPGQTADQFFGGSGSDPLPSAEEFFAQKNPDSYSGSAHDDIWSSPKGAFGKILNAFGTGAQDGWGADPIGLSKEDEAYLGKIGLFNDYKTNSQNIFKTFNEGIIRPVVAGADLAARVLRTPFYSAGAGLEETAQQIQGQKATTLSTALATPFGAAGELASAIPQGYIPEGVLLRSPNAIAALRARSLGVIGEGEAGFHDAVPLTPEHAAARTQAAHESGELPTEPAAPAVDVHELARRVDPETFEKFDALAREKQVHRETIDALAAERENLPEVKAEQDTISTILGKVNGVEDRLTNVARERLDASQQQLDTPLHTDTPEMATARKSLLDADYAMRDLVPEVASAYRQARDMMPEQPQTPEAAEPAAKKPEAPGQPAAQPAEPLPEPVPTQPEAIAREAAEQAVEQPEATGGQAEGVQSVEGTPSKEPRARGNAIKPVQGTGETMVRGLSEGVEAKAIENNLTQTFGDLPEYQQVSMAGQASKAAALIEADYDSAKAIAMGRKQPPKNLLPESVFVAVEKKALAEGDVDTLRDLATHSRLATEATTMGQRIRTLAERDPASPVGAIQEVQKARAADIASRGQDISAKTAETVREIKQSMRSTAASSRIPAWNDFITSITCAE